MIQWALISTTLLFSLLLPLSVRGGETAAPSTNPSAEMASLVDRHRVERYSIDRHLADHWAAAGAQPALPADDAEFLRRLTLDLAGRIPTPDERRAFAASPAARRRTALITQLLDGPEFSLHFARVVDDWVQRDKSGDGAFVEWLRTSLAARRPWDALLRGMLVGPWEAEGEKAANRFLLKRAKNLDTLTADGSRAFFGVDITCARCHDHPLVEDWTQEHYYGLASFFHRTQSSGSKTNAEVTEKADGELMFAAKVGGQRTARPMFLDGTHIATEEPATNKAASGKSLKVKPVSRRQQLVDAALSERRFVSRSAVNRVWAWFFGRGLVEPVDQMHSGNPASVPKLLDTLADDFAAHGYDLHRLVKQIVESQAYQATNRVGTLTERDAPSSQPFAEVLFLAPQLRPLTPRQFALSLVVAIDADSLVSPQVEERIKRYRDAEKRAVELLAGFDTTVEGYQASYREALYVANHEQVQRLIGLAGGELKPGTLVPTLVALANDEARIIGAFTALLGRQPMADELRLVAASWNAGPSNSSDPRSRVCDLVWALTTSAEFRFNH